MCLFNRKYKKQIREYKEKLYSYGVKRIDLPKLPLDYWEELLDAMETMYREFPTIFQYLYGFMNSQKTESVEFIYWGDYNIYCQEQALGCVLINVRNVVSQEAESIRLKCKEEGFHKTSSFKSYLLHELTHLLECVIMFKEKTQCGITEGIFGDYYVANQAHDISKGIFENLHGNLDRKAILGEDAYGNKDVSEFLAEAVSEYFCLDEHQQYMVQMYTEIKRLYNKFF